MGMFIQLLVSLNYANIEAGLPGEVNIVASYPKEYITDSYPEDNG